jgi:tetratricopeptide (TPR) repeat protein
MLLASLGALGAEPSPQDEARALVRNAKTAFDAGQFEEAAALLERAAALAPRPATLYNLARAREKAGQLEGAIAAYKSYLAAAPDSNDRGAVEATISDLTQRLEEKRRLESLEKEGPRIVEVPGPAPRSTRVLPWVVVGLGLAGIATGVGLGVSASSLHARAMADLSVGVDLAQGYQQRAVSQALGANIAYGVGGAIALAGLLWWILAHAGSPG